VLLVRGFGDFNSRQSSACNLSLSYERRYAVEKLAHYAVVSDVDVASL
jgi:hypothetical protein